MPREREGFRDNMERLNEFFPSRELLNVSDLVSYTGRNREVVKKLFDFKNGYISKVEVARTLS